MAARKSEPGRVLGERYRLESRLGVGGFGSVWRAQHLVLEAPVAVKLIDPEIADDERAVERFMREAKALASLRSPHVVQILDYGVDGDQPYIAMELLEGESLAQRIARLGPLSPERTARIISHISRAIGRAHEAGVVHRDLKPENVFLIHNDDEEIAKVLDFGVAKFKEGRLGVMSSSTQTGALLGTPYYMSPEQALGNKEVDYRSDLWSLGVIAFEALTGKRPFFSDGLGELVLQITVRPLPVPSEFAPVPSGFDAWFARVMTREPAERLGSAREMAESLRNALDIANQDEAMSVVTISASGQEPQALLNALKASDPDIDDADEGARIAAAKTVRVDTQGAARHTGDVSAPREPGAPRVEAVTLAQFGSSRSQLERGRPRSLVIGVAFGALTLGVLIGVAVIARSGSTDAVVRALGGPGASVAPLPLLKASAVPDAPRPDGFEGDDPDLYPTLAGARRAAASASASASAHASDAGTPDDWMPRQVDGGWVRPEWARVEEPAPPAPPPAPPPEEPDTADNPYR